MNEFAIDVRQMVKTFPGGLVILNGLDLQIHRGSVYGLLGCNGAGKTTLLRLILGLLRQDGGSLRVLGENPLRAPASVKEKIAYVPQGFQLPIWMTAEELSHYWSRLSARFDSKLALDLGIRWDLPWKRKIGQLSYGEQKKLSIVMSLGARPELLVLDEPGEGFDLLSRRELNRQLIELVDSDPRTTILISTHQVGDLEKLADHIGFIHEGKLPVSARLDDLLERIRKVQFIFDRPVHIDEIDLPGILKIDALGPVVTALVHWHDDSFLRHYEMTRRVRVNQFRLGLEDLCLEIMENPTEIFEHWQRPQQFAVVA
ncbi:MAG: ABC transporter ATP-binding protein [Verrucomicrobia bacterium]|nr:ABC transporter ATP-binding protein [Verrucomicrobiota bacterium]